jgi:hypothetical protein
MGSTRSAAYGWGLRFLQFVSSKYERAAAVIDLFADHAEAIAHKCDPLLESLPRPPQCSPRMQSRNHDHSVSDR